MDVGRSISEIIGAKAEVVGNNGSLLQSVQNTFQGLEVIEGMDNGRSGLRAGMALNSVIGANAEIVSRADSKLRQTVTGVQLGVVETLASNGSRKSPQAPKSGR